VTAERGLAVVTGASSGIGEAIARELGSTARRIILVARRRDRMERLAAELRAARPGLDVDIEAVDLGDPEATRALATRLSAQPVDVLVNNAGLGDLGLLERADAAKLEMMIQVNVLAVSLLTRAVLPGMIERSQGAILFVSSGFGLTWMPGAAAYCGTKAFVTQFAEALRCELQGTGVRVSQTCPGPVATEFEEVAGNPTGQKVPSWFQVDAATAARVALGGLRGDTAITVPGTAPWVMIQLSRLLPHVALRWSYGWMGGWLRRRPVT
jgi:short-subunit dehydrogenase